MSFTEGTSLIEGIRYNYTIERNYSGLSIGVVYTEKNGVGVVEYKTREYDNHDMAMDDVHTWLDRKMTLESSRGEIENDT